MEAIARNLKLAWRALVAKPSFSLTVVLTLALGIGANTAIFSILHALVLRNLPVAEPERLVVVSRNQLSLPYPLFRHQDHATTLDGVLAFRTARHPDRHRRHDRSHPLARAPRSGLGAGPWDRGPSRLGMAAAVSSAACCSESSRPMERARRSPSPYWRRREPLPTGFRRGARPSSIHCARCDVSDGSRADRAEARGDRS